VLALKGRAQRENWSKREWHEETSAMSQILARFIIGVAIVSAFAIIGDVLKPKSFAGL
jgi:hypothetical protein